MRLIIAHGKKHDTKEQADSTAKYTEKLTRSGPLADIIVGIDIDRTIVLIVDVSSRPRKACVLDPPELDEEPEKPEPLCDPPL